MERFTGSTLIKKEIGKNIRALRESSNLSLEELAGKVRSTPGYVGLVERGRRSFSVVKMITLADILGVTLYDLIPNIKPKIQLQTANVITPEAEAYQQDTKVYQ